MPFPFAAAISAGAGLIGGLMNRSATAKANQANADLQREFAQNSIRWKVEDAKAAGIHPLYALGAPTYSASPSFVGDTSLGSSVANMGQDISRSIDATRTTKERVDAVQKTVQDLEVTRLGLENELLAAQIRKINQPGHPPARPDLSSDPIVIAGQSIQRDPNFSDSDVITSRYGEPAEWLYSPIVGAADAWKNYGQPVWDRLTDSREVVYDPSIRNWRYK